MPLDVQNHREAVYGRVCESYHAVDDFRMKLLGLLPAATGTGVFLLLNSNTDLLGSGTESEQQRTLEQFLTAIGAFGFVFTLGLFAYELFGIKRCHYLIETGKRLEIELDVHGQFGSRPRDLLGFINEPLASALIYPASMAAWTFLAVAYTSSPWKWLVPGVVFLLGTALTEGIAIKLKRTAREAFRIEVYDQIKQKAGITEDTLAQLLHADAQAVQEAVKALSQKRLVAKNDGGQLRSEVPGITEDAAELSPAGTPVKRR